MALVCAADVVCRLVLCGRHRPGKADSAERMAAGGLVASFCLRTLCHYGLLPEEANACRLSDCDDELRLPRCARLCALYVRFLAFISHELPECSVYAYCV